MIDDLINDSIVNIFYILLILLNVVYAILGIIHNIHNLIYISFYFFFLTGASFVNKWTGIFCLVYLCILNIHLNEVTY